MSGELSEMIGSGNRKCRTIKLITLTLINLNCPSVRAMLSGPNLP